MTGQLAFAPALGVGDPTTVPSVLGGARAGAPFRVARPSALSLRAQDSDVARGVPISRRGALLSSIAILGALSSTINPKSSAAEAPSQMSEVFEVMPTGDAANPFVLGGYTKQGAQTLLDGLATCDCVFLGEHHNMKNDHDLQNEIISGLAKRKGKDGLVIGLEMVQLRFQGALDEYVFGKGTSDEEAEKALYDGVEWSRRWQWPYSQYLPVLRTARKMGVRLLALNVDTETFEKVSRGGLEMLTEEEKNKYVADKKGFISFARNPGYSKYVNSVVMPSYEFHAKMGILGPDPDPARFFAGRILWDEGMSNVAFEYMKDKPGKTMVILEGADHVKFRQGSVGRMERLAKNTLADRGFKVKSVLLNPTNLDTLAEKEEDPISLGLGYGKEGASMQISDYLWFSSPPSASSVKPGMVLQYMRN
mmetsp:Transcript_18327/g.28561  ORF Transcript_18327/g.28561 Transcript_18327/m.28561 type:complete len:421 (-) Transcript_18327:935-2197(-)|eukprot:CAMPEP_0184307176 /NCGR_PEP_ID=MMETSP1049-20130417/15990_1 /TAXON_ID=77928 /ORGANISM="Proteomonas sulcata, Strain CCMP704" /LENGTH=420 /DNA_ID=CAMNT_0026619609 /DNA_START=112 /DNA_END=1377 /DNA_ORIENTATION=+